LNTKIATLLLTFAIAVFSAAVLLYPSSQIELRSHFTSLTLKTPRLLWDEQAQTTHFELTLQNKGNTSIIQVNITLQDAAKKQYNLSDSPLQPNESKTFNMTFQQYYVPGTHYNYLVEFQNNFDQRFNLTHLVRARAISNP